MYWAFLTACAMMLFLLVLLTFFSGETTAADDKLAIQNVSAMPCEHLQVRGSTRLLSKLHYAVDNERALPSYPFYVL